MSGWRFFNCSRLRLCICANNCCIIWLICSRLAMTSKSFLTSSLEGASGATDRVFGAVHRATNSSPADSDGFNLINTPRYLAYIVQCLQSQESRPTTEFILDPQQLIVLRDA